MVSHVPPTQHSVPRAARAPCAETAPRAGYNRGEERERGRVVCNLDPDEGVAGGGPESGTTSPPAASTTTGGG